MAVNVFTFTNVCLYCKTNSDEDPEKLFHEIYDEVGLELQLPTLVESFFHIKVKNYGSQQLCDDCVNHLIELYDLDEHAKQESGKAADLTFSNSGGTVKNELEDYNANAVENTKNLEIVKENNDMCLKSGDCELPQGNCLNKSKTNHWEQNNASTLNKSNLVENTNLIHNYDIENFRTQNEEEKMYNLEYENIDNVEVLLIKNDSTIFSQEDIQDDVDIIETSPKDIAIQDFITSTSSSPMQVANLSKQEYNEDVEFIEEDDDQNMELEIMINTSQAEDLNLKNSPQNDQLSNTKSELSDIDSMCDGQNEFIEDAVYEEEELNETLVNEENNPQTNNNEEMDLEDIYIEEIDGVYYEDSILREEKECTKETTNVERNENTNSNSSTAEIQSKPEKAITSFISCATKNQYNLEELSNDNVSLEEEYLIEEIICSEEYDTVDLDEYLDKVIVTNFEDLQLNWETECKLCLDSFNTFEQLIKHSCITEFEENQEFCCIIKDCDENINNLPTLARHLILKHYEQLESLPIYGKCTDCQKTFSSIIDFNKHSCCRNIKRKAGARNYCQYCDMDFQSLKRYVFHMQFHLTYRRPKVCLLCGKLFNNPNEFFEHTQYQHIPETTMACIKCDRFFKEKDVFDSHMELHEESKYQFECSLCPKKYTNKYGLNQHMEIYHNNKSKAFICEHCEKSFANKSSYRNHIKSHESDVLVETYICKNCGLITNNTETIKHHIKDKQTPCFLSPIEEKTLGLCYTCENCSLDFMTIKNLKQHRLSKSHSDNLFHCAMCRKVFKSLRHMRNHSISHKDYKVWETTFPITRYFVCNIGDCQEFYPIWTSLYYHKKRPHKNKDDVNPPSEFKCQFCQQLCSSKMSLAVHIARSHNNSNIKCSHCKRGFKSQKLLQEHIDRYHTPMQCDICLKKFKHFPNLESHNNMVHLNIKRYFCNFCEKGYFHKSERDIHEKKVHPNVSFKCDICNFTTNYSESLKIHMDKHNNQLKFKCKMCGKAFGRKQLLQCHLKRHLNQKDYSCAKYLNESGCNETFLTHNLLKRHIELKHPNSTYNMNMQKDKVLRKESGKYAAALEIENISFEILDIEDGSRNEKSPKASTLMQFNDTDSEQDGIELVLEDGEQFDEP